jgi:thymidylate kinase
LIIFLYLPLKFAQILIVKKKKRVYLQGKLKDQYEDNERYLLKVEKMYLEMAKNNKNWVKIDCLKNDNLLPPEIIHKEIVDTLFSNLKLSAK